ncbi:MAG TPA: SAM-dependent methyltransferase [Stellaceae bacterium]
MTGSSGAILPDLQPGSIWLVGAGPGDPGLLSWLAVHALRTADAVVYDPAIEPEILATIGDDCFRQAAGPDRGGAIRRCIKLAQDGWRVVRLVSGDPFERRDAVAEATAIAEAELPFRVVPAVSPPIAGLSYAGVPLTHRDTNSAVCLLDLTQEGGDGDELPPQLDLPALAQGSPVLVLSLRRAQLARAAERLLEAGRPPETPALLVTRPASQGQTVHDTSLGACARNGGGGTGNPGEIAPLPAAPAAAGTVVLAIGASVELRRRLAVANAASSAEPQDRTRRNGGGALLHSMVGLAG